MYRTDTLNCFVVVRREVYLVSDTDEVLLRAGDTAVVQGANHPWSNRSHEPALVVGILTRAKPLPQERYPALSSRRSCVAGSGTAWLGPVLCSSGCESMLRLRPGLGGEEGAATLDAWRGHRGFGWDSWSRCWLYEHLGLFDGYRVCRPPKALPTG
jgi:hypothetical protein